MMRKIAAVGAALILLNVSTLYAQETSQDTMPPVLTEKAVANFMKNHNELLSDLENFDNSMDHDSKTAEWFSAFENVVQTEPNALPSFLKKQPAPKKLQALFKKHGLDGKTGMLQIIVIVYAVLSFEYGDAPVPLIIHPDDKKLIEKCSAELQKLLRPKPFQTQDDADSGDAQ